MRPILKLISDGGEHLHSEYTIGLASVFGLTEEERTTLLPSGTQPLYVNRIGWAVSHMSKAGLIQRTGRGRIRITERGRVALNQDSTRIDMRYLAQFPEYKEFRRGAEANVDANELTSEGPTKTPDEQLYESYQILRQTLAQDLLERIKRATPSFFEQLVIDLLVAMGYGGSHRDAAKAVGGRGDDGIDGIIKEDKLGLDFVYVQAKRWSGSVGRPIVQAFSGSLDGQKARKGVLITTSTFTNDALDYVSRIEKRLVLIDGNTLAEYMIDHGVGVSEVATYQVKKVDADYFGDE